MRSYPSEEFLRFNRCRARETAVRRMLASSGFAVIDAHLYMFTIQLGLKRGEFLVRSFARMTARELWRFCYAGARRSLHR